MRENRVLKILDQTVAFVARWISRCAGASSDIGSVADVSSIQILGLASSAFNLFIF